MYKPKLLIAALLLGALGCEEKVTIEGNATKTSQTVEYQLAVFNSRGLVQESDPTIAKFRTLLNSLDARYPEDEKKIAELSIEGQRKLEQAGRKDTLLSLMESIDKLGAAGKGGADYATAVNTYVNQRKAAPQ